MSIDEKPTAQFIEDISDNSNTSIQNNQDETKFEDDDFSDLDESKILRKMDWNILPLASALYLLAFLDRGNIGNAKIEGLIEDLDLSPDQYNLCLTIFFITYSLFEVPSNMLFKKIGKPRIFLGSIMISWGIVMTLMGIVQNFQGLFATRLFLGITEAGLFPAISFQLSMFYCKGEMQLRQAIFYGAASVAGAFSGILAFGIAHMSGVGGYRGWRWIFILEGLLTIVVAAIALFTFPDFPEKVKFLNEREKKFVLWRLSNDNNTVKDNNEDLQTRKPNFNKFNDSNDYNLWKNLKIAFMDFQIYLHLLLYYGIISPTYGISLFLPTVVKALGYSTAHAQLMTVPIYVTASISSVIQAFFADKLGKRSPFIMINLILVIVGFTMAIVGEETGKPKVIYGGVYVAILGLYSAFPGILAWLSNNLANSKKRAIGVAIHIGIGNFGGAFASNFYKGTNYTLGHSLELGFAIMGLISCSCLIISYNYINKKRLKDLKMGKFDDYTDEGFFKMGDKSPHYVYRI
ncbi:putative membrane protein [Wickerhamomyces ciferrii]|uniref:Membrane protein n=1 Tax=Wickerhamomyces ciferrii (strain ATCC 14091 / BCRC 22168 / CBS 111 / JCM 3599 / NBRC 0793 / NRRL Y-1031 F-60-10) TaxID=1206466 RepID=K0KSL8_WICCF|nr:uncharacterized protein BN7_3880 [Wickerhamomyces ciferrii]CCH44318.1 putative membrane protein [Wickerhamomyces ciferrii]